MRATRSCSPCVSRTRQTTRANGRKFYVTPGSNVRPISAAASHAQTSFSSRTPPSVTPGGDPIVHGSSESGDVRAAKPDVLGAPLLAIPGRVGPGPVRLGQSASLPLICGPSCITTLTLTLQANSTGHLNTIMTFYEIVEPPVPSPLEGLPLPILRKAIAVLTKSARAQIIAVADGEGVRFLPGVPGR